MAGETEHEVIGLGRFRPREVACDELGVGQVGYVIANIKRLSDVHIGDTITDAPGPAADALPGYQEPDAGRLLRPLPGHAQPVRGPPHRARRSSRSTTPASPSSPRPPTPSASASAAASSACSTWRSSSSGSSARATCRWSRRPRTSPTRSSPARARRSTSPTRPGSPTPGEIEEFREPIARVNFILPSESIGAIMQLCEDRRGHVPQDRVHHARPGPS